MKRVLFILSALVLFSSCMRYRSVQRIRSYRIQSIAILPVEMTMTGNMPAKMTPEAIQKRLEDGRNFMQQALYAELVRSADLRRRKNTRIQFQGVDKTKDILQRNQISDSASQSIDAAYLAKLLGVDAVLRTSVSKVRIMSNELGFGLDMAGGILRSAGVNTQFPFAGTRTGDVFVSCSLLNGTGPIWATRFANGTDWNLPPEIIMQNTARALARRLPL